MEVVNRQARHNYFVEEELECGIALSGNEVKSIKDGKASIKEAWATIENGELFVKGMHISKWDTANAFDVDENRVRKLLAHRAEINKLREKIALDGYTLIPLKMYMKKGKCKMLIGVCKGKHTYDKRETAKRNQMKRDAEKAMRYHEA